MEDLQILEQRFLDQQAKVGDISSIGPAKTHVVSQRVRDALQRLDSAKVIGILRAKHEARAVERAVELADMGFKAIEVTADSAGFNEERILPAIVKAIGDRCLVGVGTITTLAQLELSARGGAHFALSPVRPTVTFGKDGFVQECHKRGVLAMPAAYTPQEIYECVEAHGALTVKIFPAQLWSPSSLKDLKRIGDFGKYRLCPSGGIDCKNAEAWLAAGACAVGMGSCLVGKDVATDPEDKDALSAAEKDWAAKGKPEVSAFASKIFAN
jgi:2-dehydro-3-deoxyphosphogluconate aldolase/(4S)-4-hydroxy-2-oxoglutarate aldolase